ncbi:MAG: hypothetical protein ABMA26_07525 [Limisphaerales bacterium]
MKKLLLLAVLTVVGHTADADTFVGVTSATNRFLVATNEAVLVANGSGSSSAQVVKDGQNDSVRLLPAAAVNGSLAPLAIVGPCELIFTSASLLNFRRIPSGNIQTVILPPGVTTNSQTTLTIPDGKAVTFFRPSSSFGIYLQRGTNTFGPFYLEGGDKMTGPLTITLTGTVGSGQLSAVYSYFISDGYSVVPQAAGIQAPVGAFQIAVEKSVNLTNWSPAILQDIRDDQKAYYRLRITK